MSRETPFRLIAVLSIFAAIYHVAAFAAPALAIPGTPWRHVLFAVFGIICAINLLHRSEWFLLAFAALTLQQLYSHGMRAWEWWYIEHRLDWISFGVLLVLPIALTLLAQDRMYPPINKLPGGESDRVDA